MMNSNMIRRAAPAALLVAGLAFAGCGPLPWVGKKSPKPTPPNTAVEYSLLASHYAAGHGFVQSDNCAAAQGELTWVLERDATLEFLNALRLIDLCSGAAEARPRVERAFGLVSSRIDSLGLGQSGVAAVVRTWRADFEYAARTGRRIEASLDQLPAIKGELPAPNLNAVPGEYFRGRVLVTALVGETGVPLHAFVSESSLLRSYDAAAVAVLKRARFEPAMAAGTAVREFVTIPIEF